VESGFDGNSYLPESFSGPESGNCCEIASDKRKMIKTETEGENKYYNESSIIE
jgi:hypothetical protein